MGTVSINSSDKKAIYKMDRYILQTFLLVTILLFMINIICYITQNIGQNKKIIGTLSI